jgi:CBS domain containing-hemolysin-like protein
VSPWAVDALLGLLVSAPIIIFFCEITPKVIGARANLLISIGTANSLELIYNLFKPVRSVLKKITDAVARLTGAKVRSTEEVLKESDFMLMLEEGHKEGAIQENELELIKKVFEFDDTTVARVFTPLTQVQSFSVNTTLKGALTTLRTQRFSRIPITAASNRRQVLGILYSKDILSAKLDPDRMSLTVAELMRKPLFVNPGMRLNALFRKFKQQKTHMAIVQGPSGETLGVITMSDILDSLFEDVFPDEDGA